MTGGGLFAAAFCNGGGLDSLFSCGAFVSIGGSVLTACVVVGRSTVTEELLVAAAEVLMFVELTMEEIETVKDETESFGES